MLCSTYLATAATFLAQRQSSEFLHPDDDKFIACALAGNADFLVTGNKRHFPQVSSMHARVVNAAELLKFITFEL